jgi:TP901 family phage tail tape measure protein
MSGLGRVNTIVVGATSPVDVQRREQQLREIAAKREAQFQKEYRAEADRLAKERADSATARMRERAGRSSYLGQYSAQAAAEAAQAAAAQRAGTLARFGTSNVGMPAYLANANTLGRVNTIGYGATSQIDLQRQRQRLSELRASQAAEAARAAQANWPRNLRIGAGLATMTGNYQIAGGLYAGANMAQSLQKQIAEAGGFSNALQGIVSRAGAATVAVGAFAAAAAAIGGAVFYAKDYSHQLMQVGTLLESGTSSASTYAEAMGKVKDAVSGASKAHNIQAEELAKAAKVAISSGITVDELPKLLEQVATLQKATDGSAAGIIKVFTAVKSTYHTTAEDMAKVSDILFSAVDKGIFSIEEFSQGGGRLMATAAQAGISLNDIAAGMAAATKAMGGQTAVAATGYRNFIRDITAPSKDAAEALAALGIQFGENAFKGRSFYEVLTEIIAKTNGNSQLLARIFPDERSAEFIDKMISTYKELPSIIEATKREGIAHQAEIRATASVVDALGKKWNYILTTIKDIGDAINRNKALVELVGGGNSGNKSGGDLGMTPKAMEESTNAMGAALANSAEYFKQQNELKARLKAAKNPQDIEDITEAYYNEIAGKGRTPLSGSYKPGQLGATNIKPIPGYTVKQPTDTGIIKSPNEAKPEVPKGTGTPVDSYDRNKKFGPVDIMNPPQAEAGWWDSIIENRTKFDDTMLRKQEVAMNREVNRAISLKEKLVNIEKDKNKALEDAKAKHDSIMNSVNDAAEQNRQQQRSKNPGRGWRETVAEMDLLKGDIAAAAKRGDQDAVARLQSNLMSKYNSAAGMADSAGDGDAFANNRNYGFDSYIGGFMQDTGNDAFAASKKAIGSKADLSKAQVNSAIATISPAAMALIDRAVEKMKVDVKNEVNTEITANVDIDFQSIKVRVQEMMKEEFAKRADSLMKGKDKENDPNKNSPPTSSVKSSFKMYDANGNLLEGSF